MSSSTSCSVSQLLPTVREDSELSLNTNSSSHNQSISKPGSYGARPKMSKSMSALQSSSSGARNSSGPTEYHPGMSMSSASYPYHAHSSTWNPVSRQDSELQSQSSGAAPGGDTTDDNYSVSVFRPSAHERSDKMRHSGSR